MEKKHAYYEKSMSINFPDFPHTKGFVALHFTVLWEIYEETHHFSYAEVYHKMEIGWEKSTHTMGKVWVSVSQTFPIPWVLLHFPVLWEIYGETHAFPICWSIPLDGNWMGKKLPYYEKNMVIDFPDFLRTMGFAAFSCTVESLWGNPCISHMLKYTIGWESYGKKHPYYRKSMSISFPDFPHTMGFVAFSGTVGNIWGNPCISHMMTSVNFFLCLKMHSLTKMLFWVKSSGSIFSYLYFFD